MQTSIFQQHCRTLTCIVFSNTHARDFDTLECMPATTKGTVPCQTHAPGTPTGSGARPPTSRCAPSSPRRAGARHAVIEFIEAHCSRKRPRSTIGYKVPAEAMTTFLERTAPKPEELPWPPDSSSARVRNLDTGQPAMLGIRRPRPQQSEARAGYAHSLQGRGAKALKTKRLKTDNPKQKGWFA